MPHAIVCTDKPDALEIRLANRAAHIAHLEAHAGRLILAGPTLDSDGNMNGSIIVLDTDDRAEVDAFCAADPYARAGLFETVTISPFKKVFPK